MPPTLSSYIAVAAPLLAFLVTLLTAPPVIAYLRDKKLGQQVRDDGPQRHLTKAGTPTMGGVVILAGLAAGAAASWCFLPQHFRRGALLLALTLAMAAIGAADDWGKIRRGRSLGLRAREKLLLQCLISGLFAAALVYGLHGGTTIGIPGVGAVRVGWAYWPLAILFITAIGNAVNLTDGLDGLAAGTAAAASWALAAMAWLMGAESAPAAIFIGCLGAACLAFLWYNRHPARVFMGDTGSLAIGAALAGTALALKQEVLLLVIGLIYLIEMGSVIIQVIAFKVTGKRVFRMSPFHHHLELSGWSETRIVSHAWALSVALALAAFALFRLLSSRT
jgi:phospho-N-acetylmuramoyl-pentapeptide-transferase